MKVCRSCGEAQNLDCFYKHSGTRDGVGPYCKRCMNVRSAAYVAKNRQKVNERALARYFAKGGKERQAHLQKVHRERNLARAKIWREKNRDKLNEQRRQRAAAFLEKTGISVSKQQRDTNPRLRLTHRLRQRLRNALIGKYKKGSAVRDLGMPIDAFLVYLNLDAIDKYGIPYTGNEQLFHIDHIRPLVSFDLEDAGQLKQAVHWSNLQILTCEENLTKSATFTTGEPK